MILPSLFYLGLVGCFMNAEGTCCHTSLSTIFNNSKVIKTVSWSKKFKKDLRILHFVAEQQ